VLIDGMDVRTMKQRQLHRQIGLCRRISFLFQARSPITSALVADVTDEEVQQAAKLSNAHEFISQSRKGLWDTHSGRGFESFSWAAPTVVVSRAPF